MNKIKYTSKAPKLRGHWATEMVSACPSLGPYIYVSSPPPLLPPYTTSSALLPGTSHFTSAPPYDLLHNLVP